MTFGSLLHRVFASRELSGTSLAGRENTKQLCRNRNLSEAVEHVVQRLSTRLRFAPNYARTLEQALSVTIGYIDEIADSVPGPLVCSQSTFSDDPRVNAFFVNPLHLQEVFSQSEEVRQTFESNPEAEECWALLCMQKHEQTQPGIALVDDQLRRDVMQTTVSFGDHQVVSPGTDELSARCALKCCMFDGLLTHVQHRMAGARKESEILDGKIRSLSARLRRMHSGAVSKDQVENLNSQLEALRAAKQEQRMGSVAEQLEFVETAFSNPARFLKSDRCSIRLTRHAVKLESASREPGYDLDLSEIYIASSHPRIGTLVRFRRDELLPQPDMLKQADLFLAV